MIATPEALFSERMNIQPASGRYPSAQIDQCRSLVARRYVEVGYVTESDLDINGHLSEDVDPYVEDSEYFWKANEDGKLVATLRVIHPSEKNPFLPIEKSFPLFLDSHMELKKTYSAEPSSVVEISALAKAEEFDKFAALDMYKAVWQHAKQTDLKLCAMSADEKLYKMLSETFGDSISQAGSPTEMMGSLTVPALLYPDKCAEAVAKIYHERFNTGKYIAASAYKSLIGYLIEGLGAEHMSQDEIIAFESIGLSPTIVSLTKYI